MVDPTESELAGVRPNVKLPVVVMPGTLSVATEMDAAATEVTVLPAGGSVAAADSAVMIPLGVAAADMACTVKVAPLATLELILQLLVKTRVNAVVGVSAAAIVHVIVVYRTAGNAGGQTATKGSSRVVHWPVVAVVPPVVV
jgi:hypothetical protein